MTSTMGARFGPPFLPRLLLFGLLVTGTASAWLSWSTQQALRQERWHVETVLDLEAHRGRLLSAEARTATAARIAASTGDVAWEERYRSLDAQLDRDLETFVEGAPGPDQHQAAVAALDANTAARHIEARSLALTAHHQLDEAQELLRGKDYLDQIDRFTRALTTFGRLLQQDAASDREGVEREANWFLMALTLVGVVLTVGWGYLLRLIQNYNLALLRANVKLTDQAQRLRGLADELDARVEQRSERLKQEVAERKRVEAQLVQAQKMEAIGQLAGGVAHDFNNILGGIVGFAELALNETAGNEVVQDHVQEMLKGCARATDLVKQILTFSRRREHERVATQLHKVTAEVLRLLRATVPATIELRTRLPEVPTILADPSAIHQLLMNLGTNAWQAMLPRPGVFSVELDSVQVDETMARRHLGLRSGPYVRLSCRDTGAGMDPTTLEHIFEPFFTTKGAGQGTGLGLAVVHGIMTSHEGTIVVESEPGRGTTFHLYFPVYGGPAEPAQDQQGPVPHGNGEHILFVDDEEMLATLGRKVLQRLGYRVTIQTDSLKALEIVREHPDDFDLIVTDYTMPKLDGPTFARCVGDIRPDLPILLSTGNSGPLTGELMREMGIRGLLLKPNTARSLAEAVHGVLAQAS